MENKEKMTIDDQVRAALENFAQPYAAEHWQKMTERLDALDAAEAAFDTSLRGRLADISALPMADAWSKMADKLEDMDAADSSFDNALRGRLADVAVVTSMGDWSKMADKLDSFDDAETEFDDVLRRKLENIAGTHPNHWAMMNERLDREFTLKGKIVRYKVLEVALMLFAFFTLLNVLEFNTEGSNFDSKSTKTPQVLESKIDNEALKATPTPQATPQAGTTPSAEMKGLPTPTNNAKSFDNSPNWRLRSGIQSGQNKKQSEQNNLQNAQPSQQPNWVPSGQPVVDNAVQKAIYTEGGTNMTNVAQNTVLVASRNDGDNSDKSPNASQSSFEIIAPINTLQANLLANNGLDAPINIAKTGADKKGRWRLAVFGTTALDWVKTSFVDVDRVQHFQEQRVANVGINALVAYNRGKVELETGIMVNRKKYSIENIEVKTLAVVRGVITNIEKPKDLRLSIVSIPLNMNVQLKNTRRWNMYAHTGVAANAVVDAFDRREDTQPEPSNVTYSGPPKVEPILAIYSKGLMNGGETKENIYFTGQVGVGVEYKMTPKTSLFLQPTAAFMLSKSRGIGTLDDRIKTYSIQGGAKWRL